MVQHSRRHHYIPRFFSKLWTGRDGKLCEYSRPYGKLISRRKAPKAVGFERDLYSLPGAIPEHHAFLEDRFFAVGDQRACDALQMLLAGSADTLSAELRMKFTQLLISFSYRTPERILFLRESVKQATEHVIDEVREQIRTGVRKAPLSDIAFDRRIDILRQETADFSWGENLMKLINSSTIGSKIFAMRWATRRLPHSDHDLITGDHPLIGSNGFAHSKGHIALPLGPKMLFLATNNISTERQILSQSDGQIVRDANRETVRNAKRFVYASGEQHAAFVERRLGR